MLGKVFGFILNTNHVSANAQFVRNSLCWLRTNLGIYATVLQHSLIAWFKSIIRFMIISDLTRAVTRGCAGGRNSLKNCFSPL